jgi:hypothetical protein
MHWSEGDGLKVLSNRVNAGERSVGKALTFVNSAAVTPDGSSVYFTASSDVAPRQASGVFRTMRAAELTGFLVRLHLCRQL